MSVSATADRSSTESQANEVDGFAGVYPEHKHRIVTALQAQGMLVGMTGAQQPMCTYS